MAVGCGSAESKPYDAPAPFHAGSNAGTTGTGASGGAGGTLMGSGGVSSSGGSTLGGTGGDTAGNAGTLVGAGSGGLAGTSASGGTAGSALGGSAGTLEQGGTGGDLPQGGEAGSAGGADGGEGGAPPSIDCSSHGDAAVGFRRHCYLYRDQAVTWREAHDECESQNGYLVTISSQSRTAVQFLQENAFVWELAHQNEVWIGATDGRGPHQKGDGTFFEWDNGEPMDIDNWSSGQPNNSQTSCQDGIPCSCDDGACYEHCGYQWAHEGKQDNAVPGWNDRLCDHRIGFVCEWRE